MSRGRGRPATVPLQTGGTPAEGVPAVPGLPTPSGAFVSPTGRTRVSSSRSAGQVEVWPATSGHTVRSPRPNDAPAGIRDRGTPVLAGHGTTSGAPAAPPRASPANRPGTPAAPRGTRGRKYLPRRAGTHRGHRQPLPARDGSIGACVTPAGKGSTVVGMLGDQTPTQPVWVYFMASVLSTGLLEPTLKPPTGKGEVVD